MPMERDRLIELLARSEGYVSGEKLSGALSVTRAAVWKEISALRQAGWPIVSAPRLGLPHGRNASHFVWSVSLWKAVPGQLVFR